MSIREIKNQAKENLTNHWGEAIIALLIVFGIQQLVGAASALAVTILALPLTIGYARFHLNIANKDDQDYDALFIGFKNNYGDNFITQLLQYIFVFLWALLLIIPGIIKALAYAMVPYILQDESFSETGKDALRLSEKMMDGHKLELLGLYLSFILWYLLVPFTLGAILLYVQPYVSQSVAVFYDKLSHEFIDYKPEQIEEVEDLYYD